METITVGIGNEFVVKAEGVGDRTKGKIESGNDVEMEEVRREVAHEQVVTSWGGLVL